MNPCGGIGSSSGNPGIQLSPNWYGKASDWTCRRRSRPLPRDVEGSNQCPEYAALLRETSERGPSSHGAVPEEGEGLMVTYEAKLPAGGPAADLRFRPFGVVFAGLTVINQS